MLIVVTGQPRHGKTQYAMKMLLDFIKDNDKRENDGKKARNIYCDIAGVNAPDTPTKLPTVKNQWVEFGDKNLWFGEHDDPDKPSDYVCPASGSIFFYDECHKVDWIKDSAGALSKNPTTISMNEHGHEDYIFVLITQFPQYIHSHLRGLVEYHYHAKRFNGLNKSTIYKWNEFKTTPRAKTSIADIFEKEGFRFDKKYYNCYKSASAHDSMKFKLPREWAMAILLVVALLSVAIWRYNSSPIKQMVGGETDIMAANKASKNGNTVDNPILADADADADADAVALGESAATELRELKAKYLPDHIIELTKSDDILPVITMAMGSECVAYNRYGEVLNVGSDLCHKMLKRGYMPRSRTLFDERQGNAYNGNNDMQVRPVEPIKIIN